MVALYQIAFTTVHAYGSDRQGISVPVLLKFGDNSVRLAASIDTSATFCMPKANRKVNQTIRLDPDVIAAYQQKGRGWQTPINAVLREHMPGQHK